MTTTSRYSDPFDRHAEERLTALHDEIRRTDADLRRSRHLWTEAFAIRAELRRALARARGWTVARREFCFEELVTGRRSQRPDWRWRYPEIDHPDQFRLPVRPYVAAAVLSHSYASRDALLEFARSHGLRVELLPWSWYWPGACTAALFTRCSP